MANPEGSTSATSEGPAGRDENEDDDKKRSEFTIASENPSQPKELQVQSEAMGSDSQKTVSAQTKQTNFKQVEDVVKPMPIRKKHRRGSKRNRRKYKPYSKLTWEEKKAREERDTMRANKMRERYMTEKGRPTAPYNTTQFLMAEHDLEEPDLGSHHSHKTDSKPRLRSDSCSMDDSDFDEYNESSEDETYEQEFFRKDFTEAYEQVHAENLHAMSKGELVHEFMLLEQRVEDMEKQLRDTNGQENGHTSQCSQPLGLSPTSDTTSSVEELKRLREENERLSRENVELKNLSVQEWFV